ncbi:LytTR family DNA-binding domain-containing protein [Tenacibaculum singaporense]|uniref:DNA-binding response regulator n=1 Tax=Tenacibaculum singaporense TaxID=2358479 RepID=A0A3Q8RPW3_9FLAO|nr:LytTR family DNA-binding domain-containing protein [Tenacibaculum singaporense]AZJ36721.1 DNA-binding response regulator [Tenacibaculum singaporense]
MSKQLTCIIIDDEPPAIRLLEKYVDKVPFLSVNSTYTNPLEALIEIEKGTIDLVFLDIQMPEITGIQLSKIISNKTNIIFTTAYPQFALESYDIAAIDYLLKPFDFDRFYKAVLKVHKKITKSDKKINQNTENDYFFLKTDGKNKFSKVFLGDILFIEGLKNYVSVYLKNEQIITYSTLKSLVSSLPEDNFIQTHRSYIISIKAIDKIENDSLWIQKKELPIGNTYRKPFFEKIASKQL